MIQLPEGIELLKLHLHISANVRKKDVRLKRESLCSSSFSAMTLSAVVLPEPFPPQKMVMGSNVTLSSSL